MRALAIVVTLALSVSCASTSSVGTTTTVYADKTQLWLAAQVAIRDMGGRIVHADQTTGTVAGRLQVEGTPIDLNVSIAGSPAPESPLEGPWDVTARASLVGDSAPDEEWQRRLKFLTDELIERILAAASTPRGGVRP